MTQDEIFVAVRDSVAEALGLTPAEVNGDSSLLDDLGAESIDLLDMLFRVERKVGVKIKAAELTDYVTGGMSDDVFGTPAGVVSDVGLAHLEKIMPQVDADQLRGKLQAEKVINLITVQNLVDMVAGRLATTAG
jgi:acyl carrier protein